MGNYVLFLLVVGLKLFRAGRGCVCLRYRLPSRLVMWRCFFLVITCLLGFVLACFTRRKGCILGGALCVCVIEEDWFGMLSF